MNIKSYIEQIENPDKKQAAMVIGVKENKILILRRSNKEKWMPGRWNLPGGTVEKGETPRDAAKRECREESGLGADKLKLIMRTEKPHIILWLFKAELPEDQVLLDPREALDYAWISKETVDNYEFVPDCKEWIVNFLKDSN